MILKTASDPEVHGQIGPRPVGYLGGGGAHLYLRMQAQAWT